MYFKLFLSSYNGMNENSDFNRREGWGEQQLFII